MMMMIDALTFMSLWQKAFMRPRVMTLICSEVKRCVLTWWCSAAAQREYVKRCEEYSTIAHTDSSIIYYQFSRREA